MGEEFLHQGYMTEAVEAMCEWALLQDSISHIIAETESWNDASENVLRRSGFALAETGETNWWRR